MVLGGIVGMFYPLAVESFSWPAKPARPTPKGVSAVLGAGALGVIIGAYCIYDPGALLRLLRLG